MSTAWVVHPVREDLSAALRFGTLRYITEGYCYPDQLVGYGGDQFPPDLVGKVKAAAVQFNPDVDCVVMIGDHAQLLLFTSMLSVHYSTFRVLRYDRQAQGYVPIQIPTAVTEERPIRAWNRPPLLPSPNEFPRYCQHGNLEQFSGDCDECLKAAQLPSIRSRG